MTNKQEPTPPRGILLEIEYGENGLFYATSPDMPGLLVAANSFEDLGVRIKRAVAEIRAVLATNNK